MKTSLHEKDLIKALDRRLAHRKTSEKDLSIITLQLADNPLRSMQDCDTAEAASEKLQHTHAGKTKMNKWRALNIFLNTKQRAIQM